MSSERTEQPTARRIADARKKGQVVRSADLVAALSLLAVSVVMARAGASGMTRLAGRASEALSHLDAAARRPMAPPDLATLALADLATVLLVAGPFLLAAAVVVVAGNVAQTGWVLASERLAVDFSRLSPANGFRRLAPSQSWLDLLKALAAGTVVAVLANAAVRDVLVDAQRLSGLSPAGAAVEGWTHLLALLQRAGFALVVMAGADYALQRWRWTTSLRMTKQEVKDDHRMTQGNPEIKSRVRRLQLEAHRRRMLTAVKSATLVVSNPTHVAVALTYRRATMSAPVVVAKGQDLLAERIKALAREHGVPVVEQVSLARALYREAEVGEAIPAGLFGAVAEVLAYLVRARQVLL